MPKTTTRRRVLAWVGAAVLAPAGVIATATPAQAELQRSYGQVCDGYTRIPSLDREIRTSSGTLLGVVMLGRRTDVGRVCVATIKNDSVARATIAEVENVTDGVTHRDEGNYQYYAGEPCTYNPPADCSAIHARGDLVFYFGSITGWNNGDYYRWT